MVLYNSFHWINSAFQIGEWTAMGRVLISFTVERAVRFR
jgi:hypothetical protein